MHILKHTEGIDVETISSTTDSQATSDDEEEEQRYTQRNKQSQTTKRPKTTNLEEIINDERNSDEIPNAQQTTRVARAYQLEMLEASLKQNIIVAMDTGSGKTQIAILRMKAELEKQEPNKIIWFLAPGVALCEQQYKAIQPQIPYARMRLLTGSTGLDTWSGKTWREVLINVNIIISTYQVLLDALGHAFVKMNMLSLLVFDEAHNCIKMNPSARVMSHYHTAKDCGYPVPHILGLTASPIFSNDLRAMEDLELKLDAICKTPTVHREELMKHSQRPRILSVSYTARQDASYLDGIGTKSMIRLHHAWDSLDIMQDPYVINLQKLTADKAKRQLEAAIKKRKTYTQAQMKMFCAKSDEVWKDFGSWAADWYISEVIASFTVAINTTAKTVGGWMDEELVYLHRILTGFKAVPPTNLPISCADLSDKLEKLVEVLSDQEDGNMIIIFVKERVKTNILAHILTIHPKLRSRFRVGSMVGISAMPGIKQDFLDLVPRDVSAALRDFRAGRLNLLVATSVLEEGIDVPACNLVICMDKPANLKSFIQRRGRARMNSSSLYIFTEDTDASSYVTEWQKLELEMKLRYEDELRSAQQLECEEPEVEYPPLRIASTGATLTIYDARSHLQHFCTILSNSKFVDSVPEFIIDETFPDPALPPLRSAIVLLPVSIPQHIRRIRSIRTWPSDKFAIRDAAFQACKALYEEGYLDEHFQPLTEEMEQLEGRDALVNSTELMDPWLDVAKAWKRGTVQCYRHDIRLKNAQGEVLCGFVLRLPISVPDFHPVLVYPDQRTKLTIEFASEVAEPYEALPDDTCNLLHLAYPFRHAIKMGDRCVIHLSSNMPKDNTQRSIEPSHDNKDYVVRSLNGHPSYFHEYLHQKPPIHLVKKPYKGYELIAEDTPHVALKNWPKKFAFLQPPSDWTELPTDSKTYTRVVEPQFLRIDTVPLIYSQFGLILPSLLCQLEAHLLATKLTRTLLSPLHITNIALVQTAICASSSCLPTNYERIEFLGDSILKLCTTLNCASSRLTWPEGLLSRLKDSLVSNARLSRSALESKLDQFIIKVQLTKKGWRLPSVKQVLEAAKTPLPPRVMSTKTLADVVEALIGVSYLEGGISCALECMNIFMPEGTWRTIRQTRDLLFDAAPKMHTLPDVFEVIESVLDYTFHEKSILIEALTHASYNVSATVACQDRLEFIGDAILDHLVVSEIFAVNPPLENFDMHLYRTTLVNKDILAFFLMEWKFGLPIKGKALLDIGSIASEHKIFQEISMPLWSFLRHSSSTISSEQIATSKRHLELRDDIWHAIKTSSHYPWALLARLKAQKFYSDMFEALLGAIWIDSGCFAACKTFIESAGILEYFRRMIKDDVHILHPKEELGRLADTQKVTYILTATENTGVDSADEPHHYACEVLIGEKSVSHVHGALSKEEAKTLGAEVACKKLHESVGKIEEEVFELCLD